MSDGVTSVLVSELFDAWRLMQNLIDLFHVVEIRDGHTKIELVCDQSLHERLELYGAIFECDELDGTLEEDGTLEDDGRGLPQPSNDASISIAEMGGAVLCEPLMVITGAPLFSAAGPSVPHILEVSHTGSPPALEGHSFKASLVLKANSLAA